MDIEKIKNRPGTTELAKETYKKLAEAQNGFYTHDRNGNRIVSNKSLAAARAFVADFEELAKALDSLVEIEVEETPKAA